MDFRQMTENLGNDQLRRREMRDSLGNSVRQALQQNWNEQASSLAADAHDMRMQAMRDNDVSPLPGHPMNAPVSRPASGIRPGEEHVPVADALASLSARGREGLRAAHAASGDTTSFDEWAYQKYGKMAPEDRRRAMNSAGLAGDTKAFHDRRLVRDIINRDARMAPPDQRMGADARAGLLQSAPAGPLDKLRQLQWEQRAQQEAGRFERVADNNRNRSLTAALNNPRVAQGMYAASLQGAATPLAAAHVHAAVGNHRAAAQAMDLAGREMEANAEVDAARAAHQLPPDRTIAGQMSPEFAEALAMPNEAERLEAVRTIIRKSNQATPLPEEAVDSKAREIVREHIARTTPDHPEVQKHLDKFRRDKDAYMAEARRLGIPNETAERMYTQSLGRQGPMEAAVNGFGALTGLW
jgi:hypothetical protein